MKRKTRENLRYCFTEVNCHSVIIAPHLSGKNVKFLSTLSDERMIEAAKKEFVDPNLKGLLMNFMGKPFVMARIY